MSFESGEVREGFGSGRDGGAKKFAGGFKKKRKPKRKISFRKKRPPANLKFDYRDLASLLPFLTDEGKIVPARVSGLRAYQQRELTRAVKRARHVAFLSPSSRDTIY